MANNLDGVEAAGAWAFVFACKVSMFFIPGFQRTNHPSPAIQSVSSTLHTTSSSIVGLVIDCYLNCENPDLLYTLLRRVLTSIIHHCKGAEQFSAIAEILSTRFSTAVDECPSNNAERERFHRILKLISVVCSVRQGSRLSCELLPSVASSLYY